MRALRPVTTAAVIDRYDTPSLTNRQAWRLYEQILSGDRIVFQAEEPSRLEALDMAAISLVRWESDSQARYQRLTASFKVGEEDKAPDFALEVASPSTAENEVRQRATEFAGIGVLECFPGSATFTIRGRWPR